MKKYLISGALALVAGLFVTSCNHDDDVYGTGDLATQKTEAFEKAFVSAFGQINSSQNWGFYTEDLSSLTPASARARTARTRGSNVNGNQWESWNYNIPEPITAEELAAVLEVFNQKGAESYEALVDWSEFFVQQVYKGVAPYHDATDNNAEFTGSDKMNELACWNPNDYIEYIWWPEYQEITHHGGDDIINNFNAGTNTTTYYSDGDNNHEHPITGITLMQNSSTRTFSYKSSQGGGQRFYYFRMEEINGNYYVGLDFASERQASANANEQVERDYIYNDWIVKICPGKIVKTKKEYDRTFSTWGTPGRVLCEDLGNVSYNDIDYNDVVFDAQIEHRIIKHYVDWYYNDVYHHTDESIVSENDYAHITLLAAGGTMPLTVAGVEVHNAFGVGVATMVNTVTEKNGSLNGSSYVTREYVDLGEFEGYKEINDIPVIVNYTSSTGGAAVELNTTPGKAPHKILVLADYTDENGNKVKGTDWAMERANLADAYPAFKDYVASPKQTDEGEFVYDASGNLVFEGGKDYAGEKFWEKGSDADYLFSSWVSASSGEARYTTTIKTETGGDSRTTYVLYYEGGDGYDISSPLYFTNKTQLTDLKIASNDVIRIYGTAADPTNWRIAISNGNSKSVAAVGASQGKWTGYVDIYLTEEMIQKLSEASGMAAMIISGTGIVLTEVDLIKGK